jgi:hypothetical protein
VYRQRATWARAITMKNSRISVQSLSLNSSRAATAVALRTSQKTDCRVGFFTAPPPPAGLGEPAGAPALDRIIALGSPQRATTRAWTCADDLSGGVDRRNATYRLDFRTRVAPSLRAMMTTALPPRWPPVCRHATIASRASRTGTYRAFSSRHRSAVRCRCLHDVELALVADGPQRHVVLAVHQPGGGAHLRM